MPITFSCECGKKFQVKDEFAGKQTNCPVCGKTWMIPGGDEELELEETELVRPAERKQKKKKEDVTLSEPASNAGLIAAGVMVGAGVVAFAVMLMGFFQGDGHKPYQLANTTPIPGNVVGSTGPVKPISTGIGEGKDGKNGTQTGDPKPEQTLSKYEGTSAFTISTDGITAVTNKGKEMVAWDMATDHQPSAPAKSSLDGHGPRSAAPQPHPAAAERSPRQSQTNATVITAVVKSP